MTCLENETRSFCQFWCCNQVLYFRFIFVVVDYESYSISSLGVLPTVLIWIKFTHSHPFQFADSWDVNVHYHLSLDHIQFSLIHGPNIPVSCIILFFVALDFTLITRHIHNWASYLFCPSCFIHSGASGSSPLLFPSSMLDTFRPGGLVWCHIFFAFYRVHVVLTGSRVVCHFLLQWITFCQNSLLSPIHLWWSRMAWFIASLSYTSPFTTRRQWSLKGGKD